MKPQVLGSDLSTGSATGGGGGDWGLAFDFPVTHTKAIPTGSKLCLPPCLSMHHANSLESFSQPSRVLSVSRLSSQVLPPPRSPSCAEVVALTHRPGDL